MCGAAEEVFAMVVEDDVRPDIADEVPRIAGRLGNEAAFVVGIDTRRGPAVEEVVRVKGDVQIGAAGFCPATRTAPSQCGHPCQSGWNSKGRLAEGQAFFRNGASRVGEVEKRQSKGLESRT